MAKSELQEKAKELRKSGKSIKEISKILTISRSSASIWCRDTLLSSAQIEKLHQNMIRGNYRGSLIGARIQHEKKIKQINDEKENAENVLGIISKRDLLVLGIGLYLGEGGKADNRVHFTNSNKDIILCFIKWISLFGVTTNDLYCRVTINKVNEDRETFIKKEWSRLTNIPLSEFKKTSFIKTINKKVYKNSKHYLGTLSVRVKGSAKIQYKILGLLEKMMYKVKEMPA